MTVIQPKHDPIALSENFSQQEQDKKDKEWHINERAKELRNETEVRNLALEEDKSILRYFDTKFNGERLENHFQLQLSRDSRLTYTLQLFSDLYIRIMKDDDETHLPGITKPIVGDISYVNKLLDYHFNYCQEDKKEFVLKLKQGINDVAKFYFNEVKEFRDSTVGREFDQWLNRKQILLDQTPTKGKGNRKRVVEVKNLKDLFTKTVYFENKDSFYEILRVERLLDDKNKWSGKKAASRLFYDKMIEEGVFRHGLPVAQVEKIFASEFNEFPSSSFLVQVSKSQRLEDNLDDLGTQIKKVKDRIDTSTQGKE